MSKFKVELSIIEQRVKSELAEPRKTRNITENMKPIIKGIEAILEAMEKERERLK